MKQIIKKQDLVLHILKMASILNSVNHQVVKLSHLSQLLHSHRRRPTVCVYLAAEDDSLVLYLYCINKVITFLYGKLRFHSFGFHKLLVVLYSIINV